MQFLLVLATAGAVLAADPGSLEQKPFQTQAVDDRFPFGSSNFTFSTSELEEYIEEVMARWHAPGVAVAIIKGGSTWTKVCTSLTQKKAPLEMIDGS